MDTDSSSADSPQDNLVMTAVRQTGMTQVGYLSLVMLLLFTVSNAALEIVDAQIKRIDSPDLYDIMSAEVISPPILYKSATSDKPRLGLGTAAISSVTEALSPILPFTGGVDLRRSEHWEGGGGWFNQATSLVDQVRDAFGMEPMKAPFAVPRGGGQSRGSGTKIHTIPKKKKQVSHDPALSAQTPFVPLKQIAEMTLGDLADVFQYAQESTTPRFNEKRFLDGVHSRVKPILSALKNAAQKSRGDGVEPAQTLPLSSKLNDSFGNVDALQFCAAMRLFAEWRPVRQVPDGYKGFAVGMSLGHKDVVQNLGKIEKAVHEWIEHRRDVLELESQWEDGADACTTDAKGYLDCTLRSPTLRQLLEHEVDMEVHPKLPRLKEKTAGMGLLWVRRQLHYQTSLFANILQVPKKYPSANTAVSAAYKEVYDRYHGWAVQKIFTYSFQAAPEVDVIYRYMNPHELKVAQRKALQMKGSSRPAILGGASDSANDDNEELNPLQKIGNHIGGIWDNVVGIFNKNEQEVEFADDAVGGGEIDEFVTKEMTRNAHEHIQAYLDYVQPMLSDLTGLFDDMNMDDPTKV